MPDQTNKYLIFSQQDTVPVPADWPTVLANAASHGRPVPQVYIYTGFAYWLDEFKIEILQWAMGVSGSMPAMSQAEYDANNTSPWGWYQACQKALSSYDTLKAAALTAGATYYASLPRSG